MEQIECSEISAYKISDTGELPRRKYATLRTWQKFEIKNIKINQYFLLIAVKTYFIWGRKSDSSYENFLHQNDNPPPSLPILVAPPASPPQTQHHIFSCNSKQRPHYLYLRPSLSLDDTTNRIKACSLPSILNSDIDKDNDDSDEGEDGRELSKSPTSLASCGARSKLSPLHITPWKHQPIKFKRISGEEIYDTGDQIKDNKT